MSAIQVIERSKSLVSTGLRSNINPHSALYIGVSRKDRGRWTIGNADIRDARFDLWLGSKEALEERALGLIEIRRVNKIWLSDLETHFINTNFAGTAAVGCINYRIEIRPDNTAVVDRGPYNPRKFLGKKLAKKIPYFIEAVVIHYLKKMGVKSLGTSDMVSIKRESQLSECGLDPYGVTRIDVWLKGLGKGIRKHLTRLNRNGCREQIAV